MSYSYSKRSSSTSTAKSSSPSQAIEDPKKKTSLLKDRSWIRSNADQDEAVDQDPNFGRVVLNKYRSNEALDSAEPADSKSPQTTTTKTLSSVEALKKRFGGSQDDLSKGSTLPSTYGRTSTSYTKSTSPPKSDCLNTTTVSKTTVTEEPKKTSITTTTTTKGGTTTETTISTSQRVSRSPVVKSPTTNTESFTDRVFSSRKGTEDQLVSSLIPTSVKTEYLIPDSTTSVSKTDTVTLKTTKKESTSGDVRDVSKKPPTIPKGTSSKTEDDLFDTLLPTTMNARYSSPDSTTTITNKEVVTVDSPKGDVKTVKSPTSTTRTITSEEYTSTNTGRSYSSKPDNSVSVTSPIVYTTSTSYKDSSRAEDDLFDSLMSKPTKTVYSTPESPSRTVLERDLCSYCRKPMSSDPKMVLEDMKINCHTTCFKCEVCSSDLGHLKAGDSMWVYRRTVHCERCFEVTREKWHR